MMMKKEERDGDEKRRGGLDGNEKRIGGREMMRKEEGEER